MATPEPLLTEVSKTLNHMIKNVAKKEVEMKAIIQKALEVLKDYPLKEPEYETTLEGYEKDISTLATPFVQCCDPQNKFVKPSISVLQRLIVSGFVRPSNPSPLSPPLTSSSSSIFPSNNNKQQVSFPLRVERDVTQSRQLIGIIIEKICKCAEGDESTQSLVVKFLQTCCTITTCELHGSTLQTAVRTCFQLFTQSRQPQLFASAKSAITNIINHQFHKLKTSKRFKRNTFSMANITELLLQQQQQQEQQEIQKKQKLAVSVEKVPDSSPRGTDKHQLVSDIINDIIDAVVSTNISISGPDGEGVIVEDVNFSDFCMIFILICHVSTEPVRSHREVHGKLLALQILHTILSKSASTLKTSKKFVEILREHLITALNGNANTNERVFQYVLSIFLDLLQNFREDLKEELGSFFTKWLLPRLETTGATQELYWMLTIFTQISKDANLLLDLFVNYDCDFDQENLFQRSIDAVCKSARQPLVSQRFISAQYSSDFQVRSVALKCLVQLTKSLGDLKDSDRGTHQLETIVQQKEHKNKLEQARQLFADSPKKGLDAFIKLGELENTPQSIAKFLRNFRGLDKAKIGDYISRKDNNLQLMAFAELFEFGKMEFDLALRYFLSTFRLPGESMLIERLMQQFANKFYADNQNANFANPDSAFVLAYSTILLATDQHNPNIKNRMTFAQWAKNNTKINDGKDFEESYLQAIYERIGKTPLKLNESSANNDGPRKSTPFASCYRQPLVKEMMEIIWHNLVDVFDFFMQNSEDKGIVPVCLTGYQNSVHISGIFELEAARAKFLEAAIRFAKIENAKEISRKEIESIRGLAVIALFDGKYLGIDWIKILLCISNIAQVYKLGNIHEITDPVMDANKLSTLQIEAMAVVQEERDATEKQENVQFDSNNVVSIMDKISINSTLLPEDQLVLFIQAMCKVSQEEIFNFSTPTVFFFQKLIDAVYYNLSSRGPQGSGVWAKVWGIVSSLLIKVGTGDHGFALRKTALDATECLLRHFFESDVEVNEALQKELFLPFERIIRQCSDTATRSLVLQYCAQTVANYHKKIQGGWRPIFSIYSCAAHCNQGLVEAGLSTIEEMLREFFPYFASSFFVQFVDCLATFANSKYPHVSVRAIEGISSCAVHLANGRVQPLSFREALSPPRTTASLRATSELPSQIVFTDIQEHLVVWMPVLTSLSDVLSSHDLHSVRASALDTLERILILFGTMFSSRLWEMIFRGVIFPIFNNIGYSKGLIRFPEESHEWLSTTCPGGFRLLMGVFSTFLDALEFLAGEIFQLVASCFLQTESEELLRLGAQSLLRLVTSQGHRFSEQIWDILSSKVTHVIDSITSDYTKIVKSLLPPLPQPLVSSTLQHSSSLPLISPSTNMVHSSSVGSLSVHSPLPSSTQTRRTQPASLNSPATSPTLQPRVPTRSVSPNRLPPLTSTPSQTHLRDDKKSSSFPATRRTTSSALLAPHPAKSPTQPLPQSNTPTLPQKEEENNPNNNNSGINTPPSRHRRLSDVVSMPHRETKCESRISSLQLVTQIVEYVATSQSAHGKAQAQAQDTLTQSQETLARTQEFHAFLTARHLRAFANALETAFVFCHSVVKNLLAVDPSFSSSSIDVLDTTELLACSCYFKILFYLDTSKDVGNVEVEHLLIKRCYLFTSRYLEKDRVNKRLIVQLLQDFRTISDQQFNEHVGIFYQLLVKLMLDDSKKIRKALMPIWRRMGALKGGPTFIPSSSSPSLSPSPLQVARVTKA